MAQNAVVYEDDFYAWTVEQARLLRAGELAAVDAANLAEEIESIGRSDRRELQSRLVVLTMHLLKWRFQLSARSRSRSATIEEQRLQIEQVFVESRSLAAARCRHVAAGLCDRPHACDRRDRSRRRHVPGELSVYARRGAVARVSAGAVSRAAPSPSFSEMSQ